jgi:hypothetical protein
MLLAALGGSAMAQATATVAIDAGKPVNILTDQLMGAYTQMGDNDLLSDKGLSQMRAAGINTISYPTGWEGVSGIYHWSSNKITPKAGNAEAPKAPYLSPNNHFGHVAAAMAKSGLSVVVHVNYGSNAAGTGGGEPKEAAAWVAYANGDPGDTKAIGKDSTGVDWQTVGFWAGLRAAEPQGMDDGYHFLRIHHPQPLHVTLWQIGEDVAEGGFYGEKHGGSLDMHAPYPASVKDNDRRKKVKELSPKFYADRIGEYAAAMKAVDPTVKIGASLTVPTVDTFAPDWNATVLKSACKDIDFVAYEWQPGGALGPDYKAMDDASVLTASRQLLPKIIAETIYEDKASCPAGKIPRVIFSQISPVRWPKVEHPMVNALFAADMLASMAEAGMANASWFQLREGGLFDGAGKPTPAYYGLQMLHIAAFKPGDSFVAVTSAPSSLLVHATRRQDGIVGVVLMNRGMDTAQKVTVNVGGGVELAGTGVQFDYGTAQQTAGAGPVRSALTTEAHSVVVTVPPYGIVDVLMPLKK